MKIGDYVTVQEIMNQSACRWVVLSDLKLTKNDGVKGGIVRCIADTKTEADDAAFELDIDGVDTYVVSGTWETLFVGGVFVE